MIIGMAQATEKVASFPASGFVFKDSVNVLAGEQRPPCPTSPASYAKCDTASYIDIAVMPQTQRGCANAAA